MKAILTALLVLGGLHAQANDNELLVKFKSSSAAQSMQLLNQLPAGTQMEDLGLANWVKIEVPQTGMEANMQAVLMDALRRNSNVLHVQPNYRIELMQNPTLAKLRAASQNECPIPGLPKELCDILFPPGGGNPPPGGGNPPGGGGPGADNPPIPELGTPGTGADPLLSKQWGMKDIGAEEAWKKTKGLREIVVAVIDTGVDYTHEDLRDNIWRNPGETGKDRNGQDRATNGKDDDGNGYVDDVIGWDFVSNDNLPYDLSVSQMELFQGGNPGHGTHCAGNVAARGFNGKGVSGVAPNVRMMPIRFLSEKGQGTTADAVKAVMYAVQNGAHITSNSWGSVGEDTSDGNNEALKDAIRYSEQKGSLFIAAAGNGKQGVGYDNDTDSQPAYPASYDMDIIVSVAALDSSDQLGSFSNWGKRTVDIGAPGVKVFSTTENGRYNDTVLDMFGMVITWDGTSMATPHVAGAAALYMSQNRNADWREVKKALLGTAKQIPAMNGKSVSGGKLDVQALIDSM